MSDAAATPDPVTIADAERAEAIAAGLRRRHPAHPSDRARTLAELLADFEELEPTPEARRRVAAALRLAGLDAEPSIEDAGAGQRVLLTPRREPRTRPGRAIWLVAALVLICLAAVAVMQLT